MVNIGNYYPIFTAIKKKNSIKNFCGGFRGLLMNGRVVGAILLQLFFTLWIIILSISPQPL